MLDAHLRAIDSNRQKRKFHRGKVIVAIRRRSEVSRGFTRMNADFFIRVHLCESVAFLFNC
jgi:hypothetical protein